MDNQGSSGASGSTAVYYLQFNQAGTYNVYFESGVSGENDDSVFLGGNRLSQSESLLGGMPTFGARGRLTSNGISVGSPPGWVQMTNNDGGGFITYEVTAPDALSGNYIPFTFNTREDGFSFRSIVFSLQSGLSDSQLNSLSTSSPAAPTRDILGSNNFEGNPGGLGFSLSGNANSGNTMESAIAPNLGSQSLAIDNPGSGGLYEVIFDPIDVSLHQDVAVSFLWGVNGSEAFESSDTLSINLIRTDGTAETLNLLDITDGEELDGITYQRLTGLVPDAWGSFSLSIGFTPSGDASEDFFVDDVLITGTLIPEPGAAGLLFAAVLGPGHVAPAPGLRKSLRLRTRLL